MTRDGIEFPETAAIRDAVGACVRRLIQIGLPEEMALHARDAVLGTAENLLQRQRCGEWEPR